MRFFWLPVLLVQVGCAEALLGREVACGDASVVGVSGAETVDYHLGQVEHPQYECHVSLSGGGRGVYPGADREVFIKGYQAPWIGTIIAPAVPLQSESIGDTLTVYDHTGDGDLDDNTSTLTQPINLAYAPYDSLSVEVEDMSLKNLQLESAQIAVSGASGISSSWRLEGDFVSFTDVSITSTNGRSLSAELVGGGVAFDTLEMSSLAGGDVNLRTSGDYVNFDVITLSATGTDGVTVTLPAGSYDFNIHGDRSFQLPEDFVDVSDTNRRVFLVTEGGAITLLTSG